MTASVLSKVNATEWITRQSIVFDWFNSPKQGISSLVYPVAEFEFKCIAEKYNPDGVDHRLYTLHELPIGSVIWVLELIRQLGTPENKVWLPVWSFDTEEEKHRVNAEIDELLSKGVPSNLVIYTQDMVSILGCWNVDTLPANPEDLFNLFGIPSH